MWAMPPLVDRAWRIPTRAEIAACATELALRSIRSPRHRAMFARALDAARDPLAVAGPETALGLATGLAPLAFSAAGDNDETRVDLAALTFVLWTAFDVLDDIADGDLGTWWHPYGPGELMTMAGSLAASTAHLIVETLGATPSVTLRLHTRLARGLAEMADGQIDDIANTNRDLSADTVFASVAGKTGAECALFAGLGAILADAPAASIGHYERLGFEYGMANQFLSDLLDLFAAERSRDLANGTRTLPIVWHLETLTDSVARAAFLDALDAARADACTAADVRRILGTSTAVRRTLLQIMIHIERARTALAQADPRGPAAALLTRFLDDLLPIQNAGVAPATPDTRAGR